MAPQPSKHGNQQNALAAYMEDLDRRTHTLEQFVFGPEPNKAGNQPIFSIPGLVVGGQQSGGYPIYHDGQIFEFRAMILGGLISTLKLHLILGDFETQTTAEIGTLSIASGHSIIKNLLTLELPLIPVSNGDFAAFTVDPIEDGGGGARNLTLCWRIL